MKDCLKLTLLPSPVLALVEERGGGYVKRFGVKKGVRVGDDIYLSGRWYSPWRYSSDVDKKLEAAVWRLLEEHGDCVGVSISPGDEGLIFVVSFLTQNTNYYVNVLRWTSALFSKSERLEEIAEEARYVGNSYQLRRLGDAVRKYLEARPRDRADLLKIGWVGPKTADLYLLFTGHVEAAPVDKHFARYAPKLGLAGRPPDPKYCRRYICETCPLADRCLRAQAEAKLGRLAGWVQTVVWLTSNKYANKLLR
ncbi:MAG: DNA lyase [Thermoproteus sp.]